MNQWVRGSYHVNIGPQKNGPTTIMGVHILLNESLPSFIVYDVLKSYASMNAFLPLALRECALN